MESGEQGTTGQTQTDDVTVALPGASREPLTLSPGATLGRYVVVEEAGSGGVGLVVRAFDPRLHREVALKILRARTKSGEGPDDDSLLLREAQAMAMLSHPNVLAVYDVESTHLGVVIAMEYVEGQTLRDWLERGPHPWREVLAVMRAAGEGLAAAHRAGVVHCDFKPSNVLVGEDGRVRVMDFGIARWGRSKAGPPASSGISGDASSTYGSLGGLIVGTPAYMAPEQYEEPEPDARCDQYAFCLTMAEALSGDRPFAGKRKDDLIAAKRAGTWSFPASTAAPAWLRKIVLRGMEPASRRRWPSMDALLQAITRAIQRRRRWGLMGAAAAVGLVAAAGAFAVSEERSGPSCDADDALAGVWDPAAREAVEHSLRATSSDLFDATWDRLQPTLDAYAEAWIAAREEACIDTRIRGTQSEPILDRRIACLARRRRALAAAIEVLADADREVLLHAVDTVAALPPIEPCSQPDYLLAAVAPPEDAGLAERVDEVRDELARSNALRKAGRVEEAQTIAIGALDHARALDYPPLLAQALETHATAQGVGTEQAEEVLEEAYFVALASGDLERAFEVASSLVFTVGYGGGRIDDGLAWERHARAVGAALPQSLKGSLDNHVGALLARKGDIEAALEHFRRSVDRRERTGAQALDVARSLANVGGVLVMLGRLDEAEVALQESLDLFERALGPDHPDLSRLLNNLGAMASERDEYDRALAYLRRSMRLEEEAYGEHHPGVAVALDNIANVLEDKGDHEEALQTHDRVLALRRAALRPGHPDIAIALTSRGVSLASLERFEEARASFEEALSILDAQEHRRDHQQAQYRLGALQWEHGVDELARARGLALLRQVWEAARDDDDLAVLREQLERWQQTHEVSLEAMDDDPAVDDHGAVEGEIPTTAGGATQAPEGAERERTGALP